MFLVLLNVILLDNQFQYAMQTEIGFFDYLLNVEKYKRLLLKKTSIFLSTTLSLIPILLLIFTFEAFEV